MPGRCGAFNEKNLLSDQKTFNYLSKSILGQNLSLTATLCLHSLYSFHIQIYLNLLPCNNTDINKFTNMYSFLCVIKNFTKVTSSSVCIILFLKSQLLENVFFFYIKFQCFCVKIKSLVNIQSMVSGEDKTIKAFLLRPELWGQSALQRDIMYLCEHQNH